MERITVINNSGTEIYFDASVDAMCNEVREQIHGELAPCTEQEFFSAYEIAHAEKYGKGWYLSTQNPQY